MKSGTRDKSLRGYLYVRVVNVGMDGGNMDSTASPFPGLVTVDANGDLKAILVMSSSKSFPINFQQILRGLWTESVSAVVDAGLIFCIATLVVPVDHRGAYIY